MVSRTSPASSMKTSRSSSSTGSSSAGGGSRLTGTFCAGGLIGCTGAAITSARDRAGASLASASAAGGASASASGNCTSGRSRSERSSSSRLEPSQADTSPSASGKATSSGSGSSASRTSSCSAEPSKGSSAGNGSRLSSGASKDSAGSSRLRSNVSPACAAAPGHRRAPTAPAATSPPGPPAGGRGRIGGQVEAGEIDLVEAEIVQAAGRRRGRLRLAALLDHLRQRRRHFGGIVQRQVQGQVEGRLAGVGRDFAKGPVVVAGQLRGIFPRGLGRSRVGGRLLRCLGDLDDRLRPLRLGSRGLDGSGPGQARLGRGRRIRFQRIAEVRQAVLGDVEDQVALAGMVLAQALQVILDAGDGIGQGIQLCQSGTALRASSCSWI